MAFQSILGGPPYDIKVEDGEGGGRLASVAIAQSDDGDRIVSVDCELNDTPYLGEIYAEFSFSIAVISLDDLSEPFQTQDRDIAANYIPSSIRHLVMAVVCEGLKSLILDKNPTAVYWVTKDRDPHEKALQKYNMLTETLIELGFSSSDEGTDVYNRRFWTMYR